MIYAFTFYRVTGSSETRMIHRVLVTALSHRGAWEYFEAVYPPKRFTAFHMEKLPAPTLSDLLAV